MTNSWPFTLHQDIVLLTGYCDDALQVRIEEDVTINEEKWKWKPSYITYYALAIKLLINNEQLTMLTFNRSLLKHFKSKGKLII